MFLLLAAFIAVASGYEHHEAIFGSQSHAAYGQLPIQTYGAPVVYSSPIAQHYSAPLVNNYAVPLAHVYAAHHAAPHAKSFVNTVHTGNALHAPGLHALNLF
uniref:Uncharacterized protein LOC114331498 n=1 Tax=Diabrotica virgifera virgifera TaxID=50390 RepID=A0A6P7FW87_DIAVI